MKWVNISEEHPSEIKKYVIKTITPMGNYHKLEARYLGNGKFDVHGQIVLYWLYEN